MLSVIDAAVCVLPDLDKIWWILLGLVFISFFFRFYWWNIRTLTLVGSFLLVKHSKNRSGLLMAPQVEVILNPGTAATQQLKSIKTLFWVIIFILCSHIFYPCGRSLFQVPQSNLELLNDLIIMWLSGFQPMLTLTWPNVLDVDLH